MEPQSDAVVVKESPVSKDVSPKPENKLNLIPPEKRFEPYKIYQIYIKTLIQNKQKKTKEGISFVDLSPLLFILSVGKEKITAINLNRLMDPLSIIKNKILKDIKKQLIDIAKDEKKERIKNKEILVKEIEKRLTMIPEDNFIMKAESKIRTYKFENILDVPPPKKIESPKEFEQLMVNRLRI